MIAKSEATGIWAGLRKLKRLVARHRTLQHYLGGLWGQIETLSSDLLAQEDRHPEVHQEVLDALNPALTISDRVPSPGPVTYEVRRARGVFEVWRCGADSTRRRATCDHETDAEAVAEALQELADLRYAEGEEVESC